ncbi:MAG TPA: anaerobic ribonucleoside-triphosphate reductase activating protein [Lachnospiraceae bacterium]|nr:anaerobic ribonucleoside-triphosphate reductase activating protein [Lachnospiraceae bacterium]
MNYADIKICDVANGPGVRVSLFVSGCTHHCRECFNPETWDFNYGKPFTEETENEIIKYMEPDYIKGITLLGGEPMEHINQQGLLPLLRKVTNIYPEKNVWCFTGYDFEKDVTGYMVNEWKETEELLSYIDVMVDGEFIAEKKDLGLVFKGSSNQRTIMVKESMAAGELVYWDSNS